MRLDILNLKYSNIYTELFRQRSSRHHPEWGFVRDVTLKDSIPEEKEFRDMNKLPKPPAILKRNKTIGKDGLCYQ